MKRKSHYMRRGAPKAERPADIPFDTDSTRARILTAARMLFAEHGFNGTSVRDITTAARVNLAAVSYHFTTKELLYVHVLQQVVGPLAPRIELQSKVDVPALVRIERIVHALFQHIRINPDMPAFMMRELSTGLTPSGPIVLMMQRVLPAIAGVIAQGQERGEIRAGNPVLLSFSVLAQPIHLYLARGGIAAVSGLDVHDEAVIERIIAHVMETVRRSLEAR